MKRFQTGGWMACACLLLAGCSDGGTDETACRAGLVGGELVITEVMANPEGTDEGREWFELYNASSVSIELTGVALVASRADGSGESLHVMAGVGISPGQYLVVGGVEDDIKPAFVDYGYGSDLDSLLNAGGKLAVRCGDRLVDEAVYTEGEEGHARGFDGSRVPDPIANDDLDAWCDAELEYEPGSYGTPGQPNRECETSVPPGKCKQGEQIRDVVTPGPGDLVITEFMPNPAAVPDTDGEWFEVYAGRDIDLNGLELGKTPGEVATTIEDVACLPVAGGTYLLFARSADSGINGGLPPVDGVISFSLTNSGGELFVGTGGQVLDAVVYSSSADGAATSLEPTLTSPEENDNPAHWCDAEQVYGLGDKGSPGAANPSCGITPEGTCLDGGALRDLVPPEPGDLVITELMPDPDAVSDADGEWFELLVLADVDLNGMEVGRDPLDPDLEIGGADCIRVTAGSHLVFARSDDPDTNGGLPAVDYVIGFSLVNSGGNIAVGLEGEVLDQVSYTGSTTGAATSLDPGHLDPEDNDDPANWCPAADAYGLGDLGTPGGPNPACP